MACGASRLRWPKDSAVSNATEKEDKGSSENLKLMELAFRMGQQANPSSSVSEPGLGRQTAAPAFPALSSGGSASALDGIPKAAAASTPPRTVSQPDEKLLAIEDDRGEGDLDATDEIIHCGVAEASQDDGAEEDPVDKMQRALELRDGGKGKAKQVDSSEKPLPKNLGAKPKAPAVMKKPACSKVIKPKAKANSVTKVLPKPKAKKAGDPHRLPSCFFF